MESANIDSHLRSLMPVKRLGRPTQFCHVNWLGVLSPWIFFGDKFFLPNYVKPLAPNNSLRKSTRRCIAAQISCDEWNQNSDEPSP